MRTATRRGHAEAPPALVASGVALRSDMRVLWEDHIVWTRLAIISLTTGSPDTQATVARLLKNQADIGNAVKPFYGKAAGNALTAELRKHILIAADVVAAAKAGDQAKLADAQARWQANANDIAGAPEQRQSALLEARSDAGRDEQAPDPDDAGGGRQAPGQLVRPTSPPTTGSITTSCTCPTCSRTAWSSSSRSGSARCRYSGCRPTSETRGRFSWSPGGATS